MGITAVTGWDFRETSHQILQAEGDTGKFSIWEDGKRIGTVNIAVFDGAKYVDVVLPDRNFNLEEWMRFFEEMKSRFHLSLNQRIVLNK